LTQDKNKRDDQSLQDIDVEEAIKRMQTHASKTRSSFGKNLKLKAPKSAYGRLSGPEKA